MSFDAIPEDSRESHPCDCGGNIILIGEKWCCDSCDFEKLDIAKKPLSVIMKIEDQI